MDKERRDNLRQVIGEVRRLVEDNVRRQLAGYGLFWDAQPTPKEELVLRPEQQDRYPRLCDAVRREGRATEHKEQITPEGVKRYVREAGGTWVNRLAALRALEARGLLDPPATFLADEYGGMSRRAAELRERAAAAGKPLPVDQALRAAITDACTELSTSVRALFDVQDEHSLVWPDAVTLRDVLRRFSESVTEEDWQQPDILGWVYQYYNTEANAELKRRKNKTTGFKYQPDDIPIANQFYTPHWVVRVLADNTLGRLWLEQTGRLPQHRSESPGTDGATYALVERRNGVPNAATEPEAFRAWIAEEPDVLRDGTVDRLCRFLVPLPSEPPPRPKKPVRELRVLDPACGSGHFLLYAFDLLFAMYREEESGLDPREIPALILEHNLFGVDIDLRAAQLTAFALYMKARSTLAAIDSAATLRLKRVNIVVADAHIGDDPRKAAFLERYRDELQIQQLYQRILTSVDDTNVLGSLLKVRAEFEGLFGKLSEASKEKSRKQQEEWQRYGQPSLFGEAYAPQQELRQVYKGSSGKTWTLEDLLADIRRFEEEVLPAQDIGARLFYTDLERTVGLIGLLSQKYDVVLMNPPYGDMPEAAKEYATGNKKKKILPRYARTHQDYATAFLEQALDLLSSDGMVGMLVTRSFMHQPNFEAVRKQILLNESQPNLIVDLGRGILDRADVRVCAAVVRKASSNPSVDGAMFCRLAYYRDRERHSRFMETFPSFVGSGPNADEDWFFARFGSLLHLPSMPYAYWASDSLRSMFRIHPPLDIDNARPLEGRIEGKVGDVKAGLSTGEDAQFLRYHWEANRKNSRRTWLPFDKGGPQIYFYQSSDRVIDWTNNGADVQEHPVTAIRNDKFYFKDHIAYSSTSWRLARFGLSTAPIFSAKANSIFLSNGSLIELVGFLNSSLGSIFLMMQTPERDWLVSMVAAIPVAPGLAIGNSALAKQTQSLIEIRKILFTGDETHPDFSIPDLQRIYGEKIGLSSNDKIDLALLVENFRNERSSLAEKENNLLGDLSENIFALYNLSNLDRLLVLRELVKRPKAEGGYSESELNGCVGTSIPAEAGDLDESAEASEDSTDVDPKEEDTPLITAFDHSRDLVSRWLSHFVKQIIESDDDGIVPLTATHGESALIIRVREAITRDLGKDSSTFLEAQAPGYLGTADVDEWLTTSKEETRELGGKKQKLPLGFFPWHVSLYRNRPIFWMISSENFEKGKTRFTFRAFVHYLKLTPDTLPRLLAYYLDPVIDWAQAESQRAQAAATAAEGREQRKAATTAQEWRNTEDALRQFRSALDGVIKGPVKAEQVPAKAKWLPRTIAQVRGGQDVGHGYQPDVDHGVRVNITPLAEARLLPRVVLKKLGG